MNKIIAPGCLLILLRKGNLAALLLILLVVLILLIIILIMILVIIKNLQSGIITSPAPVTRNSANPKNGTGNAAPLLPPHSRWQFSHSAVESKPLPIAACTEVFPDNHAVEKSSEGVRWEFCSVHMRHCVQELEDA